MSKMPVALIPAYKPTEAIITVSKELINSGIFQTVICINDGSGAEYNHIFDKLEELGVKVFKHGTNLGKGMALRTGLNIILVDYPHTCGVVTLDADGQHLSQDVTNIASQLLKHNNKLILGCRKFDNKNIPFRSKLGNKFTKQIFRIVSGMKISDTQTGLRGIPTALISCLLRLKTTGYDFELDMLICAKEYDISYLEIPINTVYEKGNPTSSFNPLLDSFRIYFVFFRYLWVGLSSFILDFAAFMMFFSIFQLNVGVANLAARSVSSTFNFVLNRHFVFKSRNNVYKEYFKYLALVLYVITVNTSIVYFTYNYVTKFAVGVKLMAEIATFFITFIISRNFIFKNNAEQ